MFPDWARKREQGSACNQGKAQASGGGRSQRGNPFARAVPKLLALLGKIYQRGPRNALILLAGLHPGLSWHLPHLSGPRRLQQPRVLWLQTPCLGQ